MFKKRISHQGCTLMTISMFLLLLTEWASYCESCFIIKVHYFMHTFCVPALFLLRGLFTLCCVTRKPPSDVVL